MTIHQFLTSYSDGDAISNEALEIRNFLRGHHHESEIFSFRIESENACPVFNYLEYDRFSHPDNIAILHFSIGSPITETFLQIPGKKVIIYHNITPHDFYLDYHPVLTRDCYEGRRELKRLADPANRIDLALGDSQYNAQELQDAGFSHTGVLPLLLNFEKFDIPVTPVLNELFDDGNVNILFVGRLVPNKKVEDVIKTFYFYQTHFNPHSRLFLVGKSDVVERYHFVLRDLVRKLNLKHVHFTGHIPDDELIAYFKLSHLYLHLSEHEGFCAPIPESYYLNIPVVAFNAAAVKETMNNGGILVNRKDFPEMAALIHHILTVPELKTSILEAQRQALESYFQNKTGQILLDYLLHLSSHD
ncbi:MAG: glycosyltransferase family 4 protein [Candidatus Omnitrophota bacterium]